MKEKIVLKLVMVLTLASSILIVILYLDYNERLLFFESSKLKIRVQIIELYDSIELGQSTKSIQQKVVDFVAVSSFIQLHSKEKIIVRAPPELPSLTSSWDLHIFFDNGHVSAIFFRPVDGNFHLCSAPLDRGAIPELFENPKNKVC